MNQLIEYHNTSETQIIEFFNKSGQIYFNFNKYNRKELNKNGTTRYVCANPGCSVSLTLGSNNIIYRLPMEKAHKDHLPQTCIEVEIEIKTARLIDLVRQDSLGYAQIEEKYHKIYYELVLKLVNLTM